MKYKAFISYRHGGIDEKVAIQIRKQIESYRIPRKIRKNLGYGKVGRIFRDSEELRAASDLSAIIDKALDDTEWLIVICSKRYQESVWCMREIEYFLKIRSREQIIIILVEGEPEESFPKILTHVERDGEIVEIEPLAVDIRGKSDHQILKNLKREKLRFLAPMLSVEYEDLRQRERERTIKRRTAVLTTSFLALGAVIGSITYQNIQIQKAYDALDDSMQQTLRGESYYLAEYADEAYRNGDRKTAALLALEALPQNLNDPDRPFVASVMRYLTQALGIYDFSTGYQAHSFLAMEMETYDIKTSLSEDGNLLLVEKYFSAANNLLSRKLSVYSLSEERELCTYEAPALDSIYYNKSARFAFLKSDSRTLVYLSKEGLRAVDVYTGKEIFTGNTASVMLMDEQERSIVLLDYDNSLLHSCDGDGNMIFSCELEKEMNCVSGSVSRDGEVLAMPVNTGTASGILFVRLKDGKNSFANMTGECSNLEFLDENHLCLMLKDKRAGLKHIVQYDYRKGQENYISDINWNLNDMTLTKNKSCLYYKENKLYEADCRSRTGKRLWSHTFPTEIVSVQAGEDTIAVSCQDGMIYFYDLNTKKLINRQEGSGEKFYLTEVNNTYACLRDYWGKNVRIYKKREIDREDVSALDISDYVGEVPDRWYTGTTNGDRFMLGFQRASENYLRLFDADSMSFVHGTALSDLQYDSFGDLSIDVQSNGDFSIRDYRYSTNTHYDGDSFKSSLRFDANSYYFYNEDASRVFVSEGKTTREYDTESGRELSSHAIPEGYDRMAVVGDCQVFGSSSSVQIKRDSGETQVLEDRELYSFHEGRRLLFCRNAQGSKWYVYSLDTGEVVCQGTAGRYSSTMFFGENRYFLNDYSEIYDMDTWEKVLDLSDISNGVYGVHTTEKLPYFVVWYQGSGTRETGKASGSNTAYLYSKEHAGEIVAEIPNYVATAGDGDVIVYDGADMLYKMPLYSLDEILQKAKDYVGEAELSDAQKETYHLFGSR